MLTFNHKVYTKIYLPNLPIVFLHAFPLNSKMWQPQMEFLQEKAIGYIAVDYPGFGRSPISQKSITISDYASFIIELLKNLQVKNAIFVGLSMGGYVALELYRQYPEIFAGLLLANTRAGADSEEAKSKRMGTIKTLQKSMDITPVMESHIMKFFTESTRDNNMKMVNQVESCMVESTVAGVMQALSAMATRKDTFELLSRMEFPVDIIAGEKDDLIPIEESKKMAELIPKSNLHILKDTAHLSNMETEGDFNRILLELYNNAG